MNTFLKAKHWQLFLAIFGIPSIFYISMMSYIFGSIDSGGSEHDELFLGVLRIFPILILLFASILFGWLWSISVGLQGKLPPGVKMNTALFKAFMIIPFVYLLFFAIFITSFMWEFGNPQNSFMTPGGIVFIIPLHLFSMFCIFYCYYFTAKTLKSIELQREAHFQDYFGDLILFWFYVIGIWFIQPRVNKIVESNEDITGDFEQ